jgi:predicted RNA binding protein YcfA (HicA-like mRNA interferase family)
VKTPRDVSGPDLAKALRALGYEKVRQDGSHIQLTTTTGGQFHVTVPNHQSIKVGTLRSTSKPHRTNCWTGWNSKVPYSGNNGVMLTRKPHC